MPVNCVNKIKHIVEPFSHNNGSVIIVVFSNQKWRQNSDEIAIAWALLGFRVKKSISRRYVAVISKAVQETRRPTVVTEY